MYSSKDNVSISYLELDESVLLVAQAKLPRVFEIQPLDTCRLLSDPGSFRTNQVGLPIGYKYPTPYTIIGGCSELVHDFCHLRATHLRSI